MLDNTVGKENRQEDNEESELTRTVDDLIIIYKLHLLTYLSSGKIQKYNSLLNICIVSLYYPNWVRFEVQKGLIRFIPY